MSCAGVHRGSRHGLIYYSKHVNMSALAMQFGASESVFGKITVRIVDKDERCTRDVSTRSLIRRLANSTLVRLEVHVYGGTTTN